jgi:hypothetical protein
MGDGRTGSPGGNGGEGHPAVVPPFILDELKGSVWSEYSLRSGLFTEFINNLVGGHAEITTYGLHRSPKRFGSVNLHSRTK